jgi:peptidoglycan/LPS O-acetylase OafA/YrhL
MATLPKVLINWPISNRQGCCTSSQNSGSPRRAADVISETALLQRVYTQPDATYQVPRRVACGGRGANPRSLLPPALLISAASSEAITLFGDNASPKISAQMAAPLGSRNTSIQCLRGLAALSVVVYHTSFYYEATFGPALVSQATMARFAMLGVSVFFAISGSLMAQILPRTNPCKFLTHRTVRIYPTFFLVVAALLPLGDAFHVMPPPVAILGLTLAPVGNAAVYYLHVEWTLVYEITYYIVLFAIALIGAWRYVSLIATTWIVAILVAPMAFMGWSDANVYSIHSILLSPASAAFAGGLLLPWVHRHVRLPAGVGVLATCIFLTR